MRTTADLQLLRDLLEERLTVIADKAFRDSDPSGHMGALQDVSDRIEDWRLKYPDLPAKLKHYLAQASYQKALEFCVAEA